MLFFEFISPGTKEGFMIFLLTAILCSTSVNLTFAFAKSKGMNTLYLTFFNYLTACTISSVLLAKGLSASGASIGSMLSGSFLPLFAVYTGMVYLSCFLAIQFSILKNGPSITTMFNRLGMVVPVAVSIFVFGDMPGAMRWIGIILAILALMAYSYDGSFKFNGLLFGVFALGGMAELSNKLFSVQFDESLKPLYLVIVFGTCGILTSFILLSRKNKQPLTMKETFAGIFLGAVNMGTTFFILRALTVLPATVVFPALSVGVILMTALLSKIFFSEKLEKRARFALMITIVSLVFINL